MGVDGRRLARDIREMHMADRRQEHESWEKTFGEMVRQWRRARSWSQEQVAELLRLEGFDMHQTTVAKIERGARPLRVAEAAAIAYIFDVPPLAIFESRPPEGYPDTIKDLQVALDRQKESAKRVARDLENTAKQYAVELAMVHGIAYEMNQSAAQGQMEQASDAEA
ncbi:helix-turn-helix domain-containing protein [Mycobacterium sp. 852002-50816_SCH5313054-b]|uniref:helix-turn-helix domain-containing protein n=1 Tax=Mycobacterium sp. 852002-50816_SCH5313054-b TaxID=1834092 RepID=UPI0018D3482C|nr:helix-turn-helix transcriptional regulator [Mycobacterium sp. 852002-50816_SCH5313054-b]